jgi:alpha-beta hydrolase superfamily lysophospholipase
MRLFSNRNHKCPQKPQVFSITVRGYAGFNRLRAIARNLQRLRYHPYSMHDSTLHAAIIEETVMPPEVSDPEGSRQFAEGNSDRHGRLTSADGTSLFYRHWPAENWNGRVVVVLHGIGYHSGPYKVIADALNPGGTDVYGLDARGHGLSHGPRGFVGAPAKIQADVHAMVQFARQQRPEAKIFLMGDSMGGDLALSYAKHHGDELVGLVLMALALNLHLSQLLSLESARLFPNLFFAMRKPVINLIGSRLDESSRDTEFVTRRRADPLAYKNVSFGYLLDIQRLVWDWRWAIAPKVKTPMLIVKGGCDTVVSHGECVGYHRRSASPDKRLEMFPDVPHTTLWDPQSEEILQLVGEWILQH